MPPLAIVQRGLIKDQVISRKQLHDFLATNDVTISQATEAFGIPRGTRFETHKGRTIYADNHSFHVNGRRVNKAAVKRILAQPGAYKKNLIKLPAKHVLQVDSSTGRIVKMTNAGKRAERFSRKQTAKDRKVLMDTTMDVWEFLKKGDKPERRHMKYITLKLPDKDGKLRDQEVQVKHRGEVAVTVPKTLFDVTDITVQDENAMDDLIKWFERAANANDKYLKVLEHFADFRLGYLAAVTFTNGHPHLPQAPYQYATQHFHEMVKGGAVCNKMLAPHVNSEAKTWKDIFVDELDPHIDRPKREMATKIDAGHLKEFSCFRNGIMYAHHEQFPTSESQYARKGSRPPPTSLPVGGMDVGQVIEYAITVKCKFIAVDIYGSVVAWYHPKCHNPEWKDHRKVPPLYFVLHDNHASLVTRHISFGEIYWRDDKPATNCANERVHKLRKFPLPSRPKPGSDKNATPENKIPRYVAHAPVTEQLDAVAEHIKEVCFTKAGQLRSNLPKFERIAIDAASLKEHIYSLMRDNKKGITGDVRMKKATLVAEGVDFILTTAYNVDDESSVVHTNKEIYEEHQYERDRLNRSVLNRRNLTRGWHHETVRKLRAHAPRPMVCRLRTRRDKFEVSGGVMPMYAEQMEPEGNSFTELVDCEIDDGKAYFNGLRGVGYITRCDRFSRCQKIDRDESTMRAPLKGFVEDLHLEDYVEYFVEVDPNNNPEPLFFTRTVSCHLGKILKTRRRGGWRVLEKLVPSDIESIGHLDSYGRHLLDKSKLPGDITAGVLRELTGWLRKIYRESSSVQYFMDHGAAWDACKRLGTGEPQTIFADDGTPFFGVEECIVASMEETFEMTGNHIVDFVNARLSDMCRLMDRYLGDLPHSLAAHVDALKYSVSDENFPELERRVLMARQENAAEFQTTWTTRYGGVGKWTVEFFPTKRSDPTELKPMIITPYKLLDGPFGPAGAWASFTDLTIKEEDAFERDDPASISAYEAAALKVMELKLVKQKRLLIEGGAGDGKSVLCRLMSRGKRTLYVSATHVIRERKVEEGEKALTANVLTAKKIIECFEDWEPEVIILEEARLLDSEQTEIVDSYVNAHPDVLLLGNSDKMQMKSIEKRLNNIDRDVHQEHRLAILFRGNRLLLHKDKRIDKKSRELKDALMAELQQPDFDLSTNSMWQSAVTWLRKPDEWPAGAIHLTYRNTQAVWVSSEILGRYDHEVGDRLMYRGGTRDDVRTQSSIWEVEAIDDDGAHHLRKGDFTVVESLAGMKQYRFLHAATGYALQGLSCDCLVVHCSSFRYAQTDIKNYLTNALGRMTTLRASASTGFYIYEDDDVYAKPGREAAAEWMNLPDLGWFKQRCHGYKSQDRIRGFDLTMYPQQQWINEQYLKDVWKKQRGCCSNCEAELAKDTAELHRPNVHNPHLKNNGVWCCDTCNKSFSSAERLE